MTNLTPEALYMRLGQLVASMPKFLGEDDETYRWLGQAVALVEATDNISDLAALKVAVQRFGNPVRLTGLQEVPQIKAIVYSALARAELKAPASAQGTFIP